MSVSACRLRAGWKKPRRGEGGRRSWQKGVMAAHGVAGRGVPGRRDAAATLVGTGAAVGKAAAHGLAVDHLDLPGDALQRPAGTGPRHGIEQAAGVRVARVAEQLRRAGLLHQLAAIHDRHAVGHLRHHAHVVGDEEHAHADLRLQPPASLSSTDEQDLTRQAAIVESTRAAGFYVAGIYREKASGARADRAELLRMIGDLQPGEVVVAEKIDRISRLPLPEAERLVASIRAQGARLAVPGVVDLSDL
eukprot:gene35998-48429_t